MDIEVISLIFKSPKYLHSIIEEFNKTNHGEHNVKFRIVANDATESIKTEINKISDEFKNIKFTIFNNINSNEYYINRVYKAYNFAAQTCEYENLVFANSDFLIHPEWIINLAKHHDGINIPTSTLIESGKLLSGKNAISYNCGQNLESFKRNEFLSLCDHLKNKSEKSNQKYKNGGLFMPVIFNTEMFIKNGMFPEGNIYIDGVGTCNGYPIKAGDAFFFSELEQKYNMKHITVSDSFVYHIQEGEKDE